MAYVEDVNLLEHNIRVDTINKNTENLTDTSKEVRLKVNVEKTKYMLLSRHQNEDRIGTKKSKQTIGKCTAVPIFWNDSNKLKFDSGGN
jgi:hypothetical protein